MNSRRLEDLVKEFKGKNHDDPVVNYCLCQDSLEEAIKIAVLSRHREKGKMIMHHHQYKIGLKRLTKYHKKLSSYIEKIETCNNFDELYGVLESYKDKGIGELALYDIAVRIATFMEKKSYTASNMLPDKVYLHAGSEKGARILLGRNVKGIQPKSIFPAALQSLTCDEIESFLCRKGKKLSLYKED